MTTAGQHPGATLTLDSRNAKLGKGCAATYVSPVTCPESCPLRGQGCYAEEFESYVPALHELMRSTTAARDAINHEALLIEHYGYALRRTERTAPLRLHVMGDVDGLSSVMILAYACRKWPGPVWSYTHRWRELRANGHWPWGRISVLASIDHFDQAAEALALGYAPAIVVGQAPAARFDRDGVRWTHCPAQRSEKTCVRCRLCWYGDMLFAARRGIVFETHGQRRTKARMALEQCLLPFKDCTD